MKIYNKEYKTVPCFELGIYQKKSIIDFYKYIGFNVKRKQDDLTNLIAKIYSNLNYVSCSNCKYKIYKDLFLAKTPYLLFDIASVFVLFKFVKDKFLRKTAILL